MRYLITSFFLFLFLSAKSSDGFKVFIENGRYGLKDQYGEITVPAVYEELGWSDGSGEVHQEVIGYKREGKWGLVSIKNKILRANEFYSIIPFENKIKVAVKGKFSNQLFYGILNNSGEIEIPLTYFDIDILGDYYLVSVYNPLQINRGLISKRNETIISIEYSEIEAQVGWFVGKKGFLFDIFDKSRLIIEDVNHTQVVGHNLIVEKKGFKGLLGKNGVKVNPEFKEVDIELGEIETSKFPNWEILKDGSTIHSIEADSVDINSTICNYYRNGFVSSISLTEGSNLPDGFSIESVTDERILGYNYRLGKKQLLKSDGTELITSDHIEIVNQNIAIKESNSWSIFNSYGSSLGRIKFEDVRGGFGSQILVNKAGYWGISNFDGTVIVPNKFDEIRPFKGGYAVKFLKRWGVINANGDWKVSASYDEVQTFNRFIVGRKSNAFSYFNVDGRLLVKTVYAPKEESENGIIIESEDGYGLLAYSGQFLLNPDHSEVIDFGNYIVIKTDSLLHYLNSEDGILHGPYENINYKKGPYIAVQVNGRWGFADDKGRLRISNRYDSLSYFDNGLAGMFLRGRWGMIDEQERIVVQPYYDKISRTQNGSSIVNKGDSFGLIDQTGNLRLDVKWDEVKELQNGYMLFKSHEGKYGLADSGGTILLRADFDQIKVDAVGIVVRKGDKMGLLDIKGGYLLPIENDYVAIQEGFVIVKNETQ